MDREFVDGNSISAESTFRKANRKGRLLLVAVAAVFIILLLALPVFVVPQAAHADEAALQAGTNTPPTLTLAGDNPYTLRCGQPYSEPGFAASDREDGDITSRVNVEGEINTKRNGVYALTYHVEDSQEAGAEVMRAVVVTLCPQAFGNTTPTALSDAYTTTPNTALRVGAPGVLGGDRDVDGDTLTAARIGEVEHGGIVLRPDGSLVYTPPKGFSGTDRFLYRAFDGRGGSDTAQVVITVADETAAGGQQISSAATGGLYLSDFLHKDFLNDREEVLKLQAFLRGVEELPVPLSGVYDEETIAAVNAFQTRYADEVLEPWGLSEPTGFVYITTRNAINSIVSGRDIPLTPEERRSITRSQADRGGEDGVVVRNSGLQETLDSEKREGRGASEGEEVSQEAATTIVDGGEAPPQPGVFERLASAVYVGVGKAQDFIFSEWSIALLIIITILFLLYKLTHEEREVPTEKSGG